jgi:hypothetical protein
MSHWKIYEYPLIVELGTMNRERRKVTAASNVVKQLPCYHSECLLTLKPYFFTTGYLLFCP